MHDFPTVPISVSTVDNPPSRVRPYVRQLIAARQKPRRPSLAPYFGALAARRRYTTAARDQHGGIRMEGGRGVLVATADVTRAQVQGWRDRSTSQRFIAQYDAALALLLREEREAATKRIAEATHPSPATLSGLLAS